MELVAVVGVVVVLAAVIGFALPSWWWLVGPPALFAILVAIAAATGSLDGEGGWALSIALLVLAVAVVTATLGLALGVGLRKATRRREPSHPVPHHPAVAPRDPLVDRPELP
jgi:hypothetical protein